MTGDWFLLANLVGLGAYFFSNQIQFVLNFIEINIFQYNVKTLTITLYFLIVI